MIMRIMRVCVKRRRVSLDTWLLDTGCSIVLERRRPKVGQILSKLIESYACDMNSSSSLRWPTSLWTDFTRSIFLRNITLRSSIDRISIGPRERPSDRLLLANAPLCITIRVYLFPFFFLSATSWLCLFLHHLCIPSICRRVVVRGYIHLATTKRCRCESFLRRSTTTRNVHASGSALGHFFGSRLAFGVFLDPRKDSSFALSKCIDAFCCDHLIWIIFLNF